MKASKKVLKRALRKQADESFVNRCYDHTGDFCGIGKLPRQIYREWIIEAQAELEPKPKPEG